MKWNGNEYGGALMRGELGRWVLTKVRGDYLSVPRFTSSFLRKKKRKAFHGACSKLLLDWQNMNSPTPIRLPASSVALLSAGSWLSPRQFLPAEKEQRQRGLLT